MALYDPLTGLPDRALFGDRLRQSMARADRRKGALAVLLVDLGAEASKKSVSKVAASLAERVRRTDTVARFDADRFAIIQTDLDRVAEATFLAQKLLDGLEAQTCVGIALYPDDATEPEALIELAAGALQTARQRQAPFAYSARETTDAALDSVRLARDLRGALKDGQLRMHYQPKLEISSGRVTGAEALMRWEHPNRGMLTPDIFLNVARESDLIVPLGSWALHQACRDAAAWDDVEVAVNVEAEQFAEPDFTGDVEAALAASGLPSSRLELEITEASLMREPDHVVDIMVGLGKSGVSITVDDFGTGYSSLAYLRRFPVDALKIDRAFITELPGNAEDAAIVRAVISLAAALNLQVVAEGVASRAQLDFLAAEGCDIAQGYLIGKPLPPNEFARLLKER